jgi:hypothetical protein
MAVNVNGESSQGVTPGIISGSYTFPGTTTWFATSDNFKYTSLGAIISNGVSVSFDSVNGNRFEGTPIVVACLVDGLGSNGQPLSLRINGVGPSGFNIRVYNPSSSAVTVESAITVNWIAMENSGIQA